MRFVKSISCRLVCLVIVLLYVSIGNAQQHNFTNYTIEDGLPTNYVYGVVEDDRGYIWAYTEQGIARFDGYEWKAFGLNDGLSTLDCYSMCPLTDGSFLVGGKGWPSVVKGDSIFHLPIPKNPNFKDLYFQSSELREGYPPKILYLEGDPTEPRKNLLVYSVDSVNTYVASPSNDMFIGSDARIFKSDQDRLFLEESLDHLEQPQDNLFFVGQLGELPFIFWKSPFSYYRDGAIVGDGGKSTYNSCRAGVYDDQLQLYVDSVLYRYDRSLLGIVDSVNISNWCRKYDVNRVFQAKNGDLWIATRSKGILHIGANNRKIKTVSDKNKQSFPVEGVVTVDSTVYVADDRSNLYRLKSDELISIGVDKAVRKDSRYKFLRRSLDAGVVIGRGGRIVKLKQDKLTVIDPFLGDTENELSRIYRGKFNFTENEVPRLEIFEGVSDYFEYNNFVFIEDVHHHFCRNSNGDWRVGRSPHDLIFEKKPIANRGYFYVGNGDKLLRWSASNIDTLWNSDSLEISALYELENKSVLIGTKAQGVFRVSLGRDVEVDKLFSSKHVTSLASNTTGEYWATTYSGVYRFDEQGVINLHLTHDNGLPSDETYDLDFYADSVAVGTGNGLAIFAQNLTNNNALKVPDRFVQVNGIEVEGKEVKSYDSRLVLKPGEDDLEIDFSLLHPGSSGDVEYEIELEPYLQEAIFQNSRSIRFSQLDPGDYSFFVSATAIDGSKYQLEYPLEIVVETYFYRQLWFQLLCLVLLVGGGWLYYRSRLKNRYKEASERQSNEQRISELQLEALRSQMNPHFVFNALGSIQYYIQSEEKDLADSYLTKFAQLMRKYLDSSKKNLVTVREELDLLTQYMELEKMRFDHGFKFEFDIGDQVEDSDHLPSMILQPFVENAIIHGIANRKTPGGKILISISIENGETVVIISDNGIGIEHSNKLKRKGHRSRATEITNERIAAMRKSGHAKIDLSYEVPFPDRKENPGAKAILRINYDQDED